MQVVFDDDEQLIIERIYFDQLTLLRQLLAGLDLEPEAVDVLGDRGRVLPLGLRLPDVLQQLVAGADDALASFHQHRGAVSDRQLPAFK